MVDKIKGGIVSNFIDKVETRWGNVVHINSLRFDFPVDGLTVQEGISEASYGDRMKAYTLIVAFTQTGHCTIDDHKHLQANFIHELKEQIFGDVRSIERRLVRAFYERDKDALESALRDLHTELY